MSKTAKECRYWIPACAGIKCSNCVVTGYGNPTLAAVDVELGQKPRTGDDIFRTEIQGHYNGA